MIFLTALASELGSMSAAERDVERVVGELLHEHWSMEPHRGEGRQRLEHDERLVVLGVPPGARSAHVVEPGAIGIEQRAGERLEDVGDIGEQPRRLAL